MACFRISRWPRRKRLESAFSGRVSPEKTPKARPTAGIFGGSVANPRGLCCAGRQRAERPGAQRSKARTARPERAEDGARGAREGEFPLEPSGGVPRRRKGRGRRLKCAARERGTSPLKKAPREIFLYRAFSAGKRREAFAAPFGRAYLYRSEGARNERHRNKRPQVAFHISPEAAVPMRLPREQGERRGALWLAFLSPARYRRERALFGGLIFIT